MADRAAARGHRPWPVQAAAIWLRTPILPDLACWSPLCPLPVSLSPSTRGRPLCPIRIKRYPSIPRMALSAAVPSSARSTSSRRPSRHAGQAERGGPRPPRERRGFGRRDAVPRARRTPLRAGRTRRRVSTRRSRCSRTPPAIAAAARRRRSSPTACPLRSSTSLKWSRSMARPAAAWPKRRRRAPPRSLRPRPGARLHSRSGSVRGVALRVPQAAVNAETSTNRRLRFRPGLDFLPGSPPETTDGSGPRVRCAGPRPAPG